MTATITAIVEPPTGGVSLPSADELGLLAHVCETLAADVVGWVALGARVLADPDLVTSGALSPITFAEAERAVIEATIGPRGLSRIRWTLAAIAEGVRLFDAAFPEVDRAVASRLAGIASLVYGGETGVTVRPVAGPASAAPRTLPALMTELAAVNAEPDGTIEIQTITAADGSRRHVVYLPGTDDMSTLPGGRDADLRDMDENVRLVAGEHTAYEAGVLDALADAGVEPGEPVLLAGHSQGGMVAVAVASAAAGLGYCVTKVVTAGAPAPAAPPSGTTVLALENEGDIVPLTDGTLATSTRQKVTVEFASGSTGIADAHSLRHYVEGAEAIEASSDPRLREAAGEVDAFLGVPGATVTTHTYVLTRP